MQIIKENKNDILLLYVKGEIDINTSPQLKKDFDKIIAAKNGKIVMSFKDVSYIDSSGLATLVEMLKNLRSYGGKLKLANLSTKIKNLFEITKLEKLFDLTQEEEEAIKALSA